MMSLLGTRSVERRWFTAPVCELIAKPMYGVTTTMKLRLMDRADHCSRATVAWLWRCSGFGAGLPFDCHGWVDMPLTLKFDHHSQYLFGSRSKRPLRVCRWTGDVCLFQDSRQVPTITPLAKAAHGNVGRVRTARLFDAILELQSGL